jgi:hypothetical protein
MTADMLKNALRTSGYSSSATNEIIEAITVLMSYNLITKIGNVPLITPTNQTVVNMNHPYNQNNNNYNHNQGQIHIPIQYQNHQQQYQKYNNNPAHNQYHHSMDNLTSTINHHQHQQHQQQQKHQLEHYNSRMNNTNNITNQGKNGNFDNVLQILSNSFVKVTLISQFIKLFFLYNFK